ncbi:MAG: SGNH/GDSL hydrolase family protein, partial [Lentisphaeria bacterium]
AVVAVRDEAYCRVPIYRAELPGYSRGERLLGLRAGDLTAPGHLVPGSFRLKPFPGRADAFVAGTDYDFDPQWATFGRLAEGAIGKRQTVWADYDGVPPRIDAVVRDAAGQVRLRQGRLAAGVPLLTEPGAGETLLGRVWLSGPMARLEDANLFPVRQAAPPAALPPTAEQLLPRTLAKLRHGEPVTYVAWGDSVTFGCDLPWPGAGYPHRFARALAGRFPRAAVAVHSAAWPGYTSRAYLDAPAGGEYDFKRDVLDVKPDLVSIEFVNDAGFDEPTVRRLYAEILERLRGNGAEVIFITPHLVRPDWLNGTPAPADADPRLYVRTLQAVAAERQVAVADAARYWRALRDQGIPYMTYEANSINHPDERAQEFFVQALLDCFPLG